MFSTPVFAQEIGGAAASQPGLFESLLPLGLVLLVFWFLVLRPQSKKMKQHREMIQAVRRGDTVVTGGGIVGKVTRVKDDNAEVEVEIADGIRVSVMKSTLSDVRSKGEPAPVKDKN